MTTTKRPTDAELVKLLMDVWRVLFDVLNNETPLDFRIGFDPDPSDRFTAVNALMAAVDAHVTALEAVSAEPSEAKVDRVAYLETALRRIAEGRGAFSRDQLTFAGNVIEDAKRTALAAIAGTWEAPDAEG